MKSKMHSKLWLLFAGVTTIFWGIWGALIEIPELAGFPPTLSYVVWSLTMIPPALVALWLIGWKLDFRLKPALMGLTVGFTGAGGQLVLFHAVSEGPAYLVFPFVSLSPVVTILLSFILLRERARILGWIGIAIALVAIPLLSYTPPGNAIVDGYGWVILALFVFLAWGFQAYVIKFANQSMKAENIFFYMMLTGLLLAPVAIFMTDFNQPINWGFAGPGAAALIQVMNAIGALFLVYAFRYGKAMVVSPLCNAVAPVITVVLSLVIYAVIPHFITILGMIMAIIATFFLSMEEDDPDPVVQQQKSEELLEHASGNQ
ncbi:DMT family transporter [Balneolales bacterium ANBcel1]|nr:DMT family transporter [Balneolales bacterium ANBcel1]